LPAATPETTTVDIAVARMAQGNYLLRVQVDAAESALSQAAGGTFTGPMVAI
jgi:hypothetical protein